jgi:hypothetical protein
MTDEQIDTLTDEEAIVSAKLLDDASFSEGCGRGGWLQTGNSWTPFERHCWHYNNYVGWQHKRQSFDTHGNAARAYLKWFIRRDGQCG